jgi:hypothetical protein
VRKISINATIALALVSGLVTAVGAATEFDFQFHSYPNPYSPNDENYPNAKFSYVLPSSGGSISIYVYDLESRLVRTVVENDYQGPGKHAGEVQWNGADDNNEYVDPGPYVIVLEVNISGEIYRDTFVAVVNR